MMRNEAADELFVCNRQSSIVNRQFVLNRLTGVIRITHGVYGRSVDSNFAGSAGEFRK
jgi:hypothetical protein